MLHATDEIVTEFAVEEYAANAPLHVVALRTPTAKYVTYSNWGPESIMPEPRGQEYELYDYGTRGGLLELENRAGHSRLEPGLHAALTRALRDDLRRPLPGHLQTIRRAGFENYLLTATKAARGATAARLRHLEREGESGSLGPFGGRRHPLSDSARPAASAQGGPETTRPARGMVPGAR